MQRLDLSARQGFKKTRQQSDAWEAMLKDADENPGETRRLVVATATTNKFYEIKKVGEV